MCILLALFVLGCAAGLSDGGACSMYQLSPGQTAGVLIQSPNYPDLYSNDEDVCWMFSVVHGRIKLVLHEVDTEVCCDRVTITDGYSANAPQLASITGSIQAPGVLVTSGSQMYVRFVSNGVNRSKGFQACVCAETDESFCRCDDITFNDPGWEYMPGISDDYQYIHIRRIKLPIGAVVGIVLSIVMIIMISVGVPVQVCGCACTKTTQHPSAYTERRCRGELDNEDIAIQITRSDLEATKDGSLLTNSSPVRSWIVPGGPRQPPAYTAFSLPPPYQSTTVHGSATKMIISPISLVHGRLPPLVPLQAAVVSQIATVPEAAAVPQTTTEPGTQPTLQTTTSDECDQTPVMSSTDITTTTKY